MRIRSIQILRGIAVAAVVLYHFGPSYFPNGYLGVDVFFVISGYVVCRSLCSLENASLQVGTKKINGFQAFLLKRFLRLAPALGVTIFVTLIVSFFFTPEATIKTASFQGLLSLVGMGNLGALYFVGDYFHPNVNILVHTWSLSVEEQIYLVISLLIYKSGLSSDRDTDRIKIKNLFKLLLVLSLASFVVINYSNYFLLQNSEFLSNINFYFSSQRIWEFSIGSILFLGKKIPQTIFKKVIHFVSFMSLNFLLFQKFFHLTQIENTFLIISVAGIFLMTIEDLRLGFISSVLEFIGDYSYSIYLVHMPVIFIVNESPIFSAFFESKKMKLLTLPSIAILALLLKILIETKFRMQTPKKVISSRKVKQAFTLSLFLPSITIITLLAASLVLGNNFKNNPPGPPDPSELLNICKTDKRMNFCGDLEKEFPSKGKALLVGDSHARHLAPIFIDAAIEANLEPYVTTQSGCEFVLPEFSAGADFDSMFKSFSTRQISETESCFEHNKRTILWAKENPKSIIFVSLRSSSLAQLDYGISPSIFNRSLIRSLVKLKESVSEVVLIGPNPEFSDGDRFFTSNTLFWQQKYEGPSIFSMPRSEMIVNPFLDNLMLARLLPHSKIGFIESISMFCNLKTCFRNEGDGWLFTNSDHLSYEGTKKLKAKIYDKMLNAKLTLNNKVNKSQLEYQQVE